MARLRNILLFVALMLLSVGFENSAQAQRIKPVALSDLAAVPISPSIFRDHAMESKLKGAPIDWIAMEAVPTNAGATAILYCAPHPHGALLLADYILGPEGQKILEDLQFGSPAKDFGFKRWYPEAGLNTEQYDKEASRWQKTLREMGRKN